VGPNSDNVDRLKEEGDFHRGEQAARETDSVFDLAVNVIGNCFESEAFRAGYDHGLGQPKQ
jgi:hypothetical protein